tara:strand:- start:41 stop:709 length:669 start_codon:yes stop_codon:yes gene_type:complete
MGIKTKAFLKASNKDFNNVLDSMPVLGDANAFTGANTFSGGMSGNYLDFLSGNLSNLTGTPITPNDAAVDLAAATANAANILAVTLIANAINTLPDWAADAAGSVYLPVCTKDTHVVLRLLGDMDAANALNIFARGAVGAGTDVVFNKQVIGTDGAPGSVITAGTAAVPTSVQLIHTYAAAATNQLWTGSTLHFYATEDNRWQVKILATAETTGITGAYTVA